MYDMIILGAGTAGLSAALYANRAGMKVLVVEKGIYGGQIINTPLVENYPALPNVSGFDFVQNLFEQAINQHKTDIVYEVVEGYSFDGDIKTIKTNKNEYQTKTVIIAGGAEHRQLGCSGEEAFKGRGVSYCATCDGAFYKNKVTAVVGGGNTALQDARYLANGCSKVYLIHRRDTFRASKIEIDNALKKENIVPVYDSVVEEITGDQTVTAIRLKNLKTGAQSELEVSGIFVAVGLSPDNEMFRDVLELDEGGYIIAGEDCKTNIEGVFVAGDTRTKQVRQLITAAADGAVSAEMATEYINSL